MAITKRACGLLVVVGAVAIDRTALCASAAVTILSQERTLRVDAGAAGWLNSTDERGSTDLGFFEESISVTQWVQNTYPSTAFASQRSMIDATYFWMFGEVGGYDQFGRGGSGYAGGLSELRVILSSDEAFPISIRVLSNLTLYHPPGFNFVHVMDADENLVIAEENARNVLIEQTLPAGTYTFLARFFDGGNGLQSSSGMSQHNLWVTVPTVSTGTMMLMPLVVAGRRRRR